MTLSVGQRGEKSRGGEAAPALLPPVLNGGRHLESPAAGLFEMDISSIAGFLFKGSRGERSHRMRPVMWNRETIVLIIYDLRFTNDDYKYRFTVMKGRRGEH